jgi:hypothetical protein
MSAMVVCTVSGLGNSRQQCAQAYYAVLLRAQAQHSTQQIGQLHIGCTHGFRQHSVFLACSVAGEHGYIWHTMSALRLLVHTLETAWKTCIKHPCNSMIGANRSQTYKVRTRIEQFLLLCLCRWILGCLPRRSRDAGRCTCEMLPLEPTTSARLTV